MKKVSILIPIYNRLDITKLGLSDLFNALSSSQEQNTKCKFEVVVIDDGSTDGSTDWISRTYPQIHVLEGNGTLWWSGSINMGARYAVELLKSDFLLLWNDDIIPKKNYFLKLEEIILNTNLENNIIGSKILTNTIPNTIWSLGGSFNRLTGELTMMKTVADGTSKYISCDWQPGMGTLIPTSIIKQYRLTWNSIKFPQYHGDSDFTLRCKEKGIKISTNIELIIYNKIEFSGHNEKVNIRELYNGLTSTRSFYNIYRDILFYYAHGLVPFCYFGMLKKYFYYVGGFIKHSVLNVK